MERIEVRYKAVLGSKFYHKYIIYTDSQGVRRYLRGGARRPR